MADETLWHYTDAAGLLGALRNQELWASALGYLNDASEVAFGLATLKEVIGEIAAKSSLGVDDVWPGSVPLERSSTGIYAVCFTTEGDQLSQWRGYAGGAGYALGVDLDPLIHIGDGPNEHTVEPYSVRYGQEANRFLRREVESRALLDDGRLTEKNAQALLRNLPRYKHGSFAEEREWRLAILDADPKKVEFRPRAGRILPYIPVALPKQALKYVRVGPGADLAAVAAVELALERFGWSDVKVDQSESPYR